MPQPFGIGLRQSEPGREDASLMPPSWMVRVQAIIRELGEIDDGVSSVRQFERFFHHAA